MRYTFGDFRLDVTTFELRRDGETIPLEPQVFDVLVYLICHRDRVVSKEELLDKVWGDRFVSESTLTSRIKHVRRALGDDGRRQCFVKTVHGRGYRFTAEVTPAGHAVTSRADAPFRPHEAPARTAPGHHNLPADRTPLFGRDKEIADVSAMVGRRRLVSLLGIGGTGKTRLAGATGHRVLDRFSDGVWFVDLTPASDQRTVDTTIARAAGLALSAGDPRQQLDQLVARRDVLFILDNCEHVLDEVAATVDHLLGHTPDAHFLVTSREPLGLPDECRVHVEPLAVDDLAAPAVELFVSAAERFGATVDERDLPTVQRICHHLDGLPLAIELAAAQLRVLRPAEVADRLDARFELLQTRRPPGLERHASLMAVLERTWAMLGPAEQELLGRLASFPGPFGLVDVEEMSPDLPPGAAMRTLTRLTDHSLVATTSADGSRFRLLETVRLYARRRTDVHRHLARHARWCLDRIGSAWQAHLLESHLAEWCARHYDDIRVAVRHLLGDGRSDEAALLVSGTGLAIHCDAGARAADLLPMIDELLDHVEDPALRARVHITGALAGMATRSPGLIAAHGEAAVRAAEVAGDDVLLSVALVHHSWAVVMTDPAEALAMVEKAESLAAGAGDVRAQRLADSYRAYHLAWTRRYDEAIEQAEDVIERTERQDGTTSQEAFVAISALSACRAVHQPVGVDRWLDVLLTFPSRDEPMWANQVLASAIRAARGDRAGALALADAAHARMARAGRDSLPDLLVPAAALAHRLGDDERAARWVRAIHDAGHPTQSFPITCAYRRIRDVVGLADEAPLARRTLDEIGEEARVWMRSTVAG